ncbi:MAG: hypothetical protein IKE55_06885 [Kiritimatiellae bacterium]|nr:hypothetical protein [Kiritimatiellia bacterium]
MAAVVQSVAASDDGTVFRSGFSSSSSASAEDGWHVKDYLCPAYLCYSFDYSSSNTRKTPWSSLGEVQDCWFRSFGTESSMGLNRNKRCYAQVHTNQWSEYASSGDASNPLLAIWSWGAWNNTNELMTATAIGNAFADGVVRISVDMRAPKVWHGQAYLMLRPMFAAAFEALDPLPNLYPVEFGVMNNVGSYPSSMNAANQPYPYFRGGTAGSAAPTKKTVMLTSSQLSEGHWYRFVATLDLDESTWSVQMYDMGTVQPSPGTAAPADGMTLKNDSGVFYHPMSAETGPIVGLAFNAYNINRSWVSNAMNWQNVPVADNVKVEWKAPGASEFASCYENDFAQRRYRTVSPALAASGSYEAGDSVSTSVFASYPTSDSQSIVNQKFFFLTLPSGGSYATAYRGDPGIDGWRRMNAQSANANVSFHNWGGDGGAVLRVISTKDQKQTASFVNRFSGGLTTGHVRLSADVRLPSGWFVSTRRIAVWLGSSALYTASDSAAATAAKLVCAGIGNAAGSDFNPAWDAGGSWSADSSATLTANEWYRVVVTADLANHTYGYSLYSMGANTVAAGAVPAGAPICEQVGIAFSGDGANIATLGLETTAVGYSIADATLFDNLKVERSSDGTAWTTVYENDFSTRTAYEVSGCERRLVSMGLGAPEAAMDGWVRRGAGFGDVVVSGADNPAAAFSTASDSACAVRTIGDALKGGDFTFSVDIRPPVYWTLTNGFAHVILGGDEFYQGEIGTNTVNGVSLRNFENAAALRFGIGHNTGSSTMLGVFRETDVCAVVGDGSVVWNGTNFDRSLTRWYRFRAKVDVSSRTWTLSVFDMGTEHPAAESTGTLLGARSGLPLGDMPPEGITAIGLKVNGAPVGTRYYEDSDGGVLFDNVTVSMPPGLTLIFL